MLVVLVNGHVGIARAQSAGGGESAAGRSLHDVMRVVIKSPCFDSESLADQVEDWLGRDSVDGRVTSIQVRASAGVLSFLIDVTGHPPTIREFPELPRDCTEQRGAVALSIALAIDALESDLPQAAPRYEPLFMLGLQGLLSSGLPTSIGLGGAASIELRAARIVGLRLSIIAATSANDQRLSAMYPLEYNTRFIVGRGDLCLRSGSPRGWQLAGCGGFWFGDLRATSKDEAVSHAWYALSLGAELRWTGGSGFGFLVGFDFVAPLRKVRFEWDATDAADPWRDFPDAIGALRAGPIYTF